MTTEQPQTQSHSIDILLKSQLQTLKELGGLLSQELELVKKRDGNNLVALSKQKEALLLNIQSLDSQIGDHPAVSEVNDDEALSSIKQAITHQLEECQKQNEVVYLTAKQNEVVIEQVKHLLIGGSKNTTYDAYGQKKSGPSLTRGIKA